MPVPPEIKRYAQPAVVYSFVVGFVLYLALAKAGLQPAAVSLKPGTDSLNPKSSRA